MSNNADSSKMLAAVGSLLLFLSFVPVLGIVGIILLYIGLKGLSDYYNDQSIIGHAFKGLIFGIIGIIAVSALSLTTFFGWFTVASVGSVGDVFAAVGTLILTIVILVIAFVFYLLMAMNLRRAFNTLAQRSGEHMFQTAGTLLWIGAILTIIAVGLFLVWIAWLILAIAFFSMKLAPTQPYAAPPPPAGPATAAPGTRYCPNCGSPVDTNATFCPHCGKPLPPA